MAGRTHSIGTEQQEVHHESAEIKGDFLLDPAVIRALPDDCKAISANSFGSSAWTITARIDVEMLGGLPGQYFLKCATEDAGKTMMEGEYTAMCELYKTMPSFVPQPYTWGKFDLPSPKTYFFLCGFINMTNNLPDPARFCSRLAELHRNSESPTGKFGFPIPTCHGRFPQAVNWDPSWRSFFTKLLSDVLDRDLKNNGPWPALEKVSHRVVTKVLPRLLGALESNGRSVKPSLIHGDLWEGNIGTSVETGDIYIFDAGAYYAHNEMEIGMWRCQRHKIRSKVYKREYLRNMFASEPVDEWDDRNRIYCVKMNMVHSSHHQRSIVRQTAFEDMCFLVDKYAPWSSEEIDKDETLEGFAEAVENAKSH